MDKTFNQYSAVSMIALLILTAVIFILIRKPRWEVILALGIIASGLITAWALLRPAQTPLLDDAQKVQAMIGQGKPVLLEFQSPY